MNRKQKQIQQKLKRLAAGVLVASMSVSPCISLAAPGINPDYVMEIFAEDDAVDFEGLRSKWKILLTGGEMDVSNQLVKTYAAGIDELAGKHWEALIKLGDKAEDKRTCLFAEQPLTDKKTKTGSSQITLTFDRLKAIVLAYETSGSKYYKDPEVKREMIAALDLMTKNHYSVYYACGGTGTGLGSGNNSFGNWYDWRIGTPRQLCDLLLMLYDELTEEQIARYVEPIMANNKKVDTTGANRTWIANVFIQCGILLGDGDLINAGREGVKDVFKYVNTFDGFHKDGSFIQHNYYAYNGGYGKALLCTLSPMMNVLAGTPYAITYDDGCEQIFYDMIFEAYEPLIYGGRFMDMAREREISRIANQDSIPGRQAIRSVIMLIDVLPEEQKARARSMVKEWLSDEEVLAQVCVDLTEGYNEYYLPAGVIPMAMDIVDSGIEPRGSLIRHKRYGAMDRVVHLQDDFGFTISMSSNRIRNTEGTNDEGLRLWNIGDGLTYLYNEDKTYYSDHYWATVDYQRLPGTTVNRVEDRAPKAGYGTHNPYKFAGGTDLGQYGIAGMEMQGVGTTSRNGAHAKKSWFMFDDEVVAIGSDIRSTVEGSGVETVVENRKVSLEKSNTLTVDGRIQEMSGDGSADEFNGVHEGTRWIHLAGKEAGSDVGYYFPETADITGLRETRTGNWKQVNTYEKFTDDEERNNSFVTFWFDHGEKPEKAEYAYVLLPGKSADETAFYHDAPDIEILRQDEQVHAVRENKLGITGINFFEAGRCGAFRAEQPQSVMFREDKEEGTVEISFADPTQSVKELNLTVALGVLEILDKSEGVQVSEINGETVLTAVTDSPSGTAGKSFTVTLRLAKDDNMFETLEEGMLPKHWTAERGNAAIVVEDDQNRALEITAGHTDEAMASTALEFEDGEAGGMISFLLKVVNGSGAIRLQPAQGQAFDLKFTGRDKVRSEDGTEIVLEAGIWHQIKVKVNSEKNSCLVMIDGKTCEKALEYHGSMPERFAVAADAGSKVRVDNLAVRKASTKEPTRPLRLTYTEYGDTYVDLKWDASESENPLYYIISVNGTELEERTADTSYLVEGLNPEETYAFEVQAVDDDENYSEISTELSVTLIERQNDRYVINFDAYEIGDTSQHRWVYAGSDPKGRIEIMEAPAGKEDLEEDLITDVEHWEAATASPSNALEATPSNASEATPSNASETVLPNAALASPSNMQSDVVGEDHALYVYSGTAKSGVDKNVSYTFDRQTKQQTYRLKLYFDTCMKYTNFALVGSNSKQAVTMMISDSGKVGYRAGDAPASTKELLNKKIEGEWIDFVIVADPATQIFSISANGTTAEDLRFRYETTDITKLTVNAPANAIGGLYVDDIVIPADNSYQKWQLKELEEDLAEVLTVPYGTSFYDLRLPEGVEVTAELPDGEETGMDIRVNWEKGDYDGQKSGTYVICGTLAYPSNCINKIADRKIRMKVKVEKEIKQYTVNLEQSAGGTIASDVDTAEEGTDVTVTAYPDDGYRLGHWMIDGKEKKASGDSYTFALTKDVTVSAVFDAEDVEPEIKYYSIWIAPEMLGGTVTASTRYAKEGTEVVLTAVPDKGYALNALKLNGRTVEPEDDLTYTFTLSRNTNVTASFTKQTQDEGDGDDKPSGDISGNTSGGGSGSSDGNIGGRQERPSYAVDGNWRAEGGQWRFYDAAGAPLISDWGCILWNGAYEWFYFGADGNMMTGLVMIDGQTYYLQPEADGNRGRMAIGWQQIEGRWYYFNPISDGTRGAMLKDTVTPDGYRIGADGAWVE